MKAFVAGATGAIGRQLVPALRAKGWTVTAMTRSRAKAQALRALGAEPAVADALDREAVIEAVGRAAPDVVVHQLTELAGVTDLRDFDAEFARTNRLRTEGTDHLLAAALAAGARTFVAQSYGNWLHADGRGGPRTEDDPLVPVLPRQRRSVEAVRHLESVTTGARGITGIALRYGMFYGPGTAVSPVGELVALVRRRRLPIVAGGAGVWSWVHVDDAVSATIAAIERGAAGVYQVCDDDPAPVAEWLPALADAAGAPAPPGVPAWLARLLAGEVTVAMMTRLPGMSNEKARRELAWSPSIASWRDGFGVALGVTGQRAAA